ncbi:MAG TPA: T9SS type A sorting domain-containing protein, partial [Flavobacteriales bacterium]|nr:T9SS type A sorting domain-containing protein [Flavobacteriales bacterium]
DSDPSHRAQLEMDMSGYHTNMVQAANHWIQLLQTDTIPADLDTLRHVWKQVRTPAARYAEATLLLGNSNFLAADSVMEELLTEHELSEQELGESGRMIKYISVLADAAVDDRDAYHLDSVEVTVLDSMVVDHYDRPSIMIRNLLCAVYGICYTPCTGGSEGEPQSRRPDPPPPVVVPKPAVHLQPNPASNWVTISYDMPGNSAAAKLLVRDMSGRVVQEFTIGGEKGQVTWTVQPTGSGVYSVELQRGGKTLSTERLIAQP